MKKLDHPPASNRLLANLSRIGAEILLIGEMGSHYKPPRGRLGTIDLDLLRELGSILLAIARGQSAWLLLRQNERTKPRRNHANLALAYYFFRAISPDVANDSRAIKQVRAAKSLNAPAADPSIRKAAQRYRDSALNALADDPQSATKTVFWLICNEQERELLKARWESELEPGRGKLTTKDADEVARLIDNWKKYKLTTAKVLRLREYLGRKSARAV